MNLISFLSRILDYIYYRKCYICAKKCSDISLCNDCLDEIYSELNFREVKKFNTKIYIGATYEKNLLKIIRAFKYHKKSEFKEVLAKILIKTAQNYTLSLEDFVVCPVPIHANRFKKRKYNHMELVAQEFAQFFSLQVDTKLLERVKDTLPSYKLSGQERRKNIEGAFLASGKIAGKKILLLDDIVTSGTTIKELSKLILANNPAELIVMCASRSNNCNF